MKRQHTSQLLSSQQSVFYYLNTVRHDDTLLSRRPNYLLSFYPSMLIEDVTNHILPYSSHNKAFQVIFEPLDKKVEKMIAEAISRDDYFSVDLAYATHDFFVQCVQTIMVYEKAIYELVYLSNRDDGTVCEFQLVSILPGTVLRKRGQLVQYVPTEIAQARKVPQYITLTSDRIITFTLPSYVQKEFGAMMKDLLSLSNKHFIPDFAFQVKEDGSSHVPFDSKNHLYLQRRALAEAGKLIGWNARRLFSEETLEYYDLYRALKFERFKIELRTSILEKVNEALSLAGQKVGFTGHIRLHGMPTLKEVEEAQAHLSSGEQSFSEILKPFQIY